MSSPAKITDQDRFGVSLTFALIFHGILILGIGFSVDEVFSEPPLPELDVILVNQSSEEAPEKADFLAQASQQGGGDTPDRHRPQSPVSGPSMQQKGIAPQIKKKQRPKAETQKTTQVITAQNPDSKQALTSHKTPKPTPRISATELLQQSLELARLEAEINQDLKTYAKRPRRKFISANTRESVYAAYMHAWVNKVERVGNINYPDQARRQGLTGSLVVTVAIHQDGQVEKVEILTPSGHRILDEAVLRIIKLAAPFAPLPQNIRDETDVLSITRTWQFLPGNKLGSQ